MADFIIRAVRNIEGVSTDVAVRDGRIVALTSAAKSVVAAADIDGRGYVLLPPLVESHVHLDKTLWGEPWRPNSAGPTLKDYIGNERRILATVATPIRKRAGALLEHCIAQGSLHFRSHIDVAPDIGVKHVQAMLELRAAYGDVVDMQFVAFPQTGLLTAPGTAELIEESLKMGVETVGGIDPQGIDGDVLGQLRVVFGLAERYDRGVDIHLHDRGEIGIAQVEQIAEFTAASGLERRVMISHAYCLGMATPARLESVGRRLADLGISLMTSAPADTTVPPVAALRAMGVNICCGSDGIRDAWSPMGNGDMLERAMLLAYRFDWGKDEELRQALNAATSAGAKALGLEGYGLEVGRPADFVLVKAENVADAVVRRPRERLIFKSGSVIAREGVFLDSRLSA
ncbi:MAG TPA: amidohydrolase family protein [Verrucomicrobiae bacterium]|nr:amidohydrolase family protein [Verrucomicrobiae bacterium]